MHYQSAHYASPHHALLRQGQAASFHRMYLLGLCNEVFERNHLTIAVAFRTFDGGNYTPQSVRIKANDVWTGTEMLADSSAGDPAPNMEVLIPASVSQMVDQSNMTEHREISITSEPGTPYESNITAALEVRNLRFVQ